MSRRNLNADALSHLPGNVDGEPEMNYYAESFCSWQLDLCPVDKTQLQEAGVKTKMYREAIKYTLYEWPEKLSLDLEASFKRNIELTVEEGCLLWFIQKSRAQTTLFGYLVNVTVDDRPTCM